MKLLTPYICHDLNIYLIHKDKIGHATLLVLEINGIWVYKSSSYIVFIALKLCGAEWRAIYVELLI